MIHPFRFQLEGGVDDYIAKPFSTRELLARIRAVLRRASSAPRETVIAVKGLQLDIGSRRVPADGQRLELGPTESRLLQFIMAHSDRVHSRAQLVNTVRGANDSVKEPAVDVYVRRLREKLAPFGYDRSVETVHGVGYRFSFIKDPR